MRRLVRLGSSHRVRAGLITAGVAVGVLLLAFLGGVLMGKTEHQTAFHGTGSLPPVVSTTTTTLPDAAIAAIKGELVEDMALDVESQRLDPDPAKRVALAQSAAAVAARHQAIATAWAPSQASAIEAQYDRLVVANARNRRAPSVLHAAFVVISWGDIAVDGDVATVTLRGHYQLTEPATTVNQIDQTWSIVLHLDDGRWRLQARSAA